MTLRADTKTPVTTRIDVKQGGQVYRLHDRSPLIRWAADYTVTSIGTGDGYDIIVVTTGGVTQYALVRSSETSNRRPLGTMGTMSTTPTRISPLGYISGSASWTAGWSADGGEWVGRGAPGTPKMLLVHGGPGPADGLAGMDALAANIAQRGGVGIAVKYPTMDTSFEDCLRPLYAAVNEYKPDVIVGHSLGGYFGGILAYRLGLPLVLIAAVHTIGDSYRLGMGGPLASEEMKKSTNPVTIITGANDMVARIEYHQEIANQLAATGHPGKWWIIEGGTHDSVLSDGAAMNIIMAL